MKAGRNRWIYPSALALAVLVHLALLFVRIPLEPTRMGSEPLLVLPRPAEISEKPRPVLDGALTIPGIATDPPPASTAPPRRSTGSPRVSAAAPVERTIPPTDLRLEAPLQPLEIGAAGIGRRPPERGPREARRVAIARAESLVNARLVSLPGVERRDTGAIGLANGGLTVAIPWAGFLPADRYDEGWRGKRCAGENTDAADKAGEAEARRSQCD